MDRENVKRLPDWIRQEKINLKELHHMKAALREKSLHTVCESAMCPNRGECFRKGTATYLLLGDICTRNCGFCNVTTGRPQEPDRHEPERVAESVHQLGIKYAVLTMVNRDDLPDGGAGIVAETIRQIKQRNPETRVEALVGDFQGNIDALNIIFKSEMDVFNHNIEMVESCFTQVRHKADYQQSLRILRYAADTIHAPVKSGFMVGLGETDTEIEKLMHDLFNAGVSILTIGQYLRPSQKNVPVVKYYAPEEFQQLTALGKRIGFRRVFAGPFVRSSYMAEEVFGTLNHA